MITHDLQLTGSCSTESWRCAAAKWRRRAARMRCLRSELLAEIYGEPNVRARRIGNQTLVWIDA